MTHGSLFAGIGGFDLGFQQAGWKTVWQVEIEPFCRSVLENRFPGAHRFSDIRQCGARNLEQVDCITAGVPCQDVSVAGKRRGLAGKRTGLFYHFARILCELRPAWFVFENVPGLFSSNQGRDFAEVLRVLMVRCGYGVSWRCLNSRFFGVAQRRKRLFIVGSLGKPCPPEILFEPTRGRRDSTPGAKAGESVAYAIAAGSGGSKFGSGRQGQDTFVSGPLCPGTHPGGFNGQDAYNGNIVAHTLRENQENTSQGPGNYVAARIKPSPYADHGDERHNLIIANPIADSGGHGHRGLRGDGCDNLVAAPLSAGSHDKSSAPGRRREDDFNLVATLEGRNNGGFRSEPGDHLVCATLRGGGDTPGSHGKPSGTDRMPLVAALYSTDGGYSADRAAANNYVSAPTDPDRVRDATGISEGLDDPGFLPTGLDSARYRALGNAVTVQVAAWIARRILNAAR